MNGPEDDARVRQVNNGVTPDSPNAEGWTERISSGRFDGQTVVVRVPPRASAAPRLLGSLEKVAVS